MVESRIESSDMNSESLKQISEMLIKKIQILKEKRLIVTKYIKKCVQSALKVSAKPKWKNLSQISIAKTEDNEKTVDFDNRFIIHNLHLLWTPWIRNIFFKLIYLQTQNISLRYYLTNAAVKVIRDIIKNASIEKNDEKSKKKTSTDKSQRPFSKNQELAEQLLAQLVEDQDKNFIVPNETQEQINQKPNSYRGSPSIRMMNDNNSNNQKGQFLTESAYVASDNPDSPDFIPPNLSLDSEYIVEFINPQISLESFPKDNPSMLESLTIAAETGSLQSVFIIDYEVV